ncbi:MAG: C40 family peptidase [Bacteroidota bacterium]
MNAKPQTLPYFSLVILLVVCGLYACAQNKTIAAADSLKRKSNDSSQVKVTNESQIPKTLKADSVIKFAEKFIGLNYRRGGTSNRGYDCSGFTMMIFAKYGVRLPHTSAGQGLIGIEINTKNIQKGDLIFFKGRSRKGLRIGHVGMVISNKGEPVRFIHSSVSDGVRIDFLDSPYYRKRFVKVNRVVRWEQ